MPNLKMDSLDCLKGLFELHQNLFKISERPPRLDFVFSHDENWTNASGNNVGFRISKSSCCRKHFQTQKNPKSLTWLNSVAEVIIYHFSATYARWKDAPWSVRECRVLLDYVSGRASSPYIYKHPLRFSKYLSGIFVFGLTLFACLMCYKCFRYCTRNFSKALKRFSSTDFRLSFFCQRRIPLFLLNFLDRFCMH